MKTIEANNGQVYEIATQDNDILLMAPDHTLVLHGADLADGSIERYIDDNFDLAKRIDHPYEAKMSLFELMQANPKI